ncbi:MAG: hypothetical protein H0W64_07535 [Gammaproteobacteria bacterium]|nr:hypothetical protein [Gammaproteobacteria bacterium]
MKNKTLSKTNPYLKDPAKRKKLVARSTRTSSAVEGVELKLKQSSVTINQRKPKKIYKNIKPTDRARLKNLSHWFVLQLT